MARKTNKNIRESKLTASQKRRAERDKKREQYKDERRFKEAINGTQD